MSGKIRVHIRIDKQHELKEVPTGMELLAGKALRGFIPPGSIYEAYLGDHEQTINYYQGDVKARRAKDGVLTLVVQPGGKKTCYEVHVKLGGKLNAHDVLKRMKGVRENGDNINETEESEMITNPTGSTEPTRLIETRAVQEEREMKNSKKNDAATVKVKLNIMGLIEDKVSLGLILLYLSDLQKEKGSIDVKEGAAAIRKEGLVGVDFSNQSVSRIFPVLNSSGYIEVFKKKGCYKISEKGEELLVSSSTKDSTLQAESPESVPSLDSVRSDNARGRNDLQSGINILSNLMKGVKNELKIIESSIKEKEAELVILHQNKQKSESELREIRDKIKCDLGL